MRANRTWMHWHRQCLQPSSAKPIGMLGQIQGFFIFSAGLPAVIDSGMQGFDFRVADCCEALGQMHCYQGLHYRPGV